MIYDRASQVTPSPQSQSPAIEVAGEFPVMMPLVQRVGQRLEKATVHVRHMQRWEHTVHAEYGVCHNNLSFVGRRSLQKASQMVGVSMCIHLQSQKQWSQLQACMCLLAGHIPFQSALLASSAQELGPIAVLKSRQSCIFNRISKSGQVLAQQHL